MLNPDFDILNIVTDMIICYATAPKYIDKYEHLLGND
jgi:hypothetical protein